VLERVALGQTRFAVPGVGVDSRGIVLGKLGVLLFPSLDGVVAWLRLYSDEDSLDDLISGMKVLRVRTSLGSRAMALHIPAASSYVLDRAARCARLAGGSTFTGTSKHFVKYRDERSPQGYDVVDLQAVPQGAELVLHSDDVSQAFARDGEIDVRSIILRLQPRRIPGSEKLDAAGRAELYCACPRGLGHGLVRYLLRSGARTEVALVVPREGSAFASPSQQGGLLLARVREMPERVLASLRGVPGIGVFQAVCDNVVVEVGWRHPVALSSCASLFAQDRFTLLWGDGRVDEVAGPLELSAAEHLIDLHFPHGAPAEPRQQQAVAAEPIATELRLVPTLAPPRRVVGTLLAGAELPRLKRLVYSLPPAMLAGHRVAVTTHGALLLARENDTIVPLGTPLTELAPNILVPLGMDLVPRVSVEVLQSALSRRARGEGKTTGAAVVTVFPLDGPPFAVPQGDLAPLERKLLARVPVEDVAAEDLSYAVPSEDPSVVNDPVGRFSLWGFKPARPDLRADRALPSKTEPDK
jgi:hypothetical protein